MKPEDMSDDALWNGSSEKRRRLEPPAVSGEEASSSSLLPMEVVDENSATAGAEMVVINFDLVFNENLSVFRAYNKRGSPGCISVSLYCDFPQSETMPDGESRSISLYHSKILCEMLNAATSRPESSFYLQDAFCKNSSSESLFFVDIDLGFNVPILRVELKEYLNFGNVQSVSGGVNCLGNHNHWSFGHWQPAWSGQVTRLPSAGNEEKTRLGAVLIPKKASSVPVGVLRVEMNLTAKDVFPTDFTTYARMMSGVGSARNFSITIPSTRIPTPPPMEMYSFRMPSFESLPNRALMGIVNSLTGFDRVKLLLSLSGTCRRFRDILRDRSLYDVIDFKVVPPSHFSNSLLNFFSERASAVRHLRVSWQPHLPEGFSFAKFLRRLPPTLESFVADACPFIDDKVLNALSETQPNLETLELTRCRAISPDAFRYILAFKKLRRLSVQQTNVGERPLCEIVENLRHLEVFNISSLVAPSERRGLMLEGPMSRIVRSLTTSSLSSNLTALNLNLCQVDLTSFTALIRRCGNLQELMCIQPDFFEGQWNSSFFAEIAQFCPQMRRLSLAELPYRKALTDEQFSRLTTDLPQLEHLFVVPAEILAEHVAEAFDRSNNLNSVVLAGRKIVNTQLDELRVRYPTRNFIYVDFRPLWHSESSDDESSSDSDDNSNEDSDAPTDNSDEDHSFDSGSEESKSDLERFQHDTNASLTTLVTSIRDLTNSLEQVRALMDNLLSKKGFLRRKTLIAEIRFAMATSIYYERFEVLAMLMERCPNKELMDVLTGESPLLNFAIKRHSVEAVRVLLENGAPPNPERAMSGLGTVVTTLMDIFDDADYDEALGSTFCEICELLFSRNANPLFFHPDERGTNVLHYSAYIAGHAPQIATLLIEKTPGAAYFSQEFFGTQETDGPSPLASVFDMIDLSDDVRIVYNNFKYALMPLLRYGAPYLPDTVFTTSMLSEIVSLDHAFSKRLWGRPYVLAQILIEARRTSSFNASALLKASSPRRRRNGQEPAAAPENNANINNNINNNTINININVNNNNNNEIDDEDASMDSGEDDDSLDEVFDGVSDDETGDLIKPFAAYVRSQFPRNLQAQCRTAILGKLPHGPDRLKAVDQLDLPKLLTAYLKFAEFEIPDLPKNETNSLSS